MPQICYVPKDFRNSSLVLIGKINDVIEDYADQGYTLTLRQCYYQLVARGIIENNQRSYKNVGSLINDARLAGLIDWYSIEDRTRNLRQLSHWSSPQQIIESVANQYRRNRWRDMPHYVEVWVEKEALSNVVGRAANGCDVPYFCCRGYVSQSEMWSAARRFKLYQEEGKHVVLIYLGDHDPSGIDMTRDIQDRLDMFGVNPLYFDCERIALNLSQIDQYNPPPNPAKITDSRASSYITRFGNESWELDALEPKVLNDLIVESVSKYVNWKEWNRVKDLEEYEKKVINSIASNWDSICDEYGQ